ncbi:MAG TPA: DUF58 domain-containing protein [Candidatus Hydrogenedentes bacterium]|nr:DUF58 domain-containing protein [Candidatus Hydrogenedentota bacterium]HPG69053.1 DUF58 domain-containing protein [Candidatus Hydrogenedentota bacterium]
MSQTYQYFDPKAAARLGSLRLIARSVVEGFIAGLHRSPYHGSSLVFSEHRNYVKGDDPRHIDWRAYCRSERLYVKQYEEETNLRAYILLDASASMGYGSGEITKLQYGCYLAASLAYLMIRQQDSVGLVVFDQDIRTFLPPRSTPSHFKRLLGHMEQIEPGRETDVSTTFHNLANHLKRRGLIIIISDLFDDPRLVLRAVRHFRHRQHEVILFHLFDHDELTLPFAQMTEFKDMETGARIQIEPPAIRSEYLRLVEEFIDTYRRDCAESRVDYLEIDTQTPYDRLLQAYLVKRARLG